MLQRPYPELFALVGSHVPDFRGLFLRGFGQQSHSQNNGSTVGVTSTTHKSGALGKVQGDAIRNITGEISSNYINHPLMEGRQQDMIFSGVFSSGKIGGLHNQDTNTGLDAIMQLFFDASYITPTAEEIRPVNVAVRYLIRARS